MLPIEAPRFNDILVGTLLVLFLVLLLVEELVVLLALLALLLALFPAEKDSAELPEFPDVDESMDTDEFVVSLLLLEDLFFVFEDFVASA